MKQEPKYERIKNILMKDITAGKYPPGGEVPSENELMQEFGVSRITAKRTIDELYRDGYIEKRQGKRGYVKERPRIQELTTISSYTEEIIRQGMVPSRRVICAKLRLATQEEQELLALDKTDPVFYLKRVIYADAAPLCYTATTLPYRFFRDVELYDFTEYSLYDVIENKYLIRLSSSQLKLRAVLAGKDAADELNIMPDHPVLLSSAVTYGLYHGSEVPVEMFETYYLTDRFEYKLSQRRQ